MLFRRVWYSTDDARDTAYGKATQWVSEDLNSSESVRMLTAEANWASELVNWLGPFDWT